VTANRDYDLAAVTGSGSDDAGVPAGRLLVEFAEAALGEDDAALSRIRAALLTALGRRGLVDAAAIVGLFDAIDRVADATGIPLEADEAAHSADIRAALGLDRFAVATRD
jgi:hypothetical protein